MKIYILIFFILQTRLAYETNEKESQSQKGKYEEACTEPKGALGAMKNMLRTGDASQRIEKVRNFTLFYENFEISIYI